MPCRSKVRKRAQRRKADGRKGKEAKKTNKRQRPVVVSKEAEAGDREKTSGCGIEVAVMDGSQAQISIRSVRTATAVVPGRDPEQVNRLP